MSQCDHRLPSIYFSADDVHAGGLISYGSDLIAQFRRSAHYISRILDGAKPADLPVDLPARFELAVNLMTARRWASRCRSTPYARRQGD